MTKTKKSLLFQMGGGGIVFTCPECGSHNVDSDGSRLDWTCLSCNVEGRM